MSTPTHESAIANAPVERLAATVSCERPTPTEQSRASSALVKEFDLQIADVGEKSRRLDLWISSHVGGGLHPRRAQLNELNARLRELHAARTVAAQVASRDHTAASRARADASRAEFSRLATEHLEAALAFAASAARLRALNEEVTVGGEFATMLPRLGFHQLGEFSDPTSAIRLLLREAKRYGVECPDAARFGFTVPAEL